MKVALPHVGSDRRKATVAVLIEQQLQHYRGVFVRHCIRALHDSLQALNVVGAETLADGNRLRERLIVAEKALEPGEGGHLLERAAIEDRGGEDAEGHP